MRQGGKVVEQREGCGGYWLVMLLSRGGWCCREIKLLSRFYSTVTFVSISRTKDSNGDIKDAETAAVLHETLLA